MVKITRLSKNKKGKFYLTIGVGKSDEFVDLDITEETYDDLIGKLAEKNLITETRSAANAEYHTVK